MNRLFDVETLDTEVTLVSKVYKGEVENYIYNKQNIITDFTIQKDSTIIVKEVQMKFKTKQFSVNNRSCMRIKRWVTFALFLVTH